ncbi:glucose-1-phosphate adenylyltransferase [Clostridium tertium]|jgi:glucose-1-phosphate adenylyltransferase|uniref:glucose-1-phosphate adenylyltransferase n=1 Tax=Clostridium TaxID=1485 RepID=UPI00019B0550|nr:MULTISPECIES: glucose-1-phosphate adenylyltransferase [Clostridium]EEH99799.1 glucose-1-phosphate adenylyltransferase [Clostridium sp. 7_2_43FAA]MBU6137391.1 glucose-1-phosphate adenylyltransferase [Clostridium tertium]MDB1941956.1 glucose-1-phosphate adenylyltransferase [Clostridium tertium]MDB1956951.1 glucose-1-phosphate adenylyltransferase [Clostridium tertium]MDB1960418.1 glucose-1-phosphate adenylyltransferase [Clostridium tertium]
MGKKEIVAMILAGGQGSRLGVLTKRLAKPAVPFGGKYRIIDFPLSNCSNSGIYTVGVLTQYKPLELNTHIGIGSPWDLDRRDGGVRVLPPYQEEKGGKWYKGTANAIYQNIEYVDRYNPEYILILSGDHIYKMNYDKMLEFHKQKKADATIAVIDIPIEEASRFGIMNTRDDLSIYEFEEKPQNPKSTKASMGIYIFNWSILKRFLIEDENNIDSSNDFGKDIIPNMLNNKMKLVAYPFEGYWKDVGTIRSLWEANMDLLNTDNKLSLYDNEWKIYSENIARPAQYIGSNSNVNESLVVEGCIVEGDVEHSVIFQGVSIGRNSIIRDSVIMSDTKIEDNVVINKAIVGSNAIIRSGCKIGDGKKIAVIASKEELKNGTTLEPAEAL